jgi:pimeloyl-ACP methyl ester carboxylesterase
VGLGTVFAPDLPGFGLSALGGGGATLAEARNALAGVVAEHAGGRPVVLAGHSMGGAIAAMQAAAAPASVEALVLTSSVVPLVPRGALGLIALARMASRRLRVGLALAVTDAGGRPAWPRRENLSLERVLVAGLTGSVADPASADPELVAARAELGRSQDAAEAVRAMAGASRSLVGLLARPGAVRRMLGRVRCPVLAIHGAEDRQVPVGLAVAATRQQPGWELHVLPGVGHMAPVEAPGEWSATVAGFLARHGLWEGG